MARVVTMPFGRYRLEECLGAGGMAQVYLAVSEGPVGFSRTLVIKRVLPQFSQDPGFVKMLLNEARVSALLDHPGIVQVHELGEVDGEYFIAMEYVDGHDLTSLLRRCNQQQRALPVALCLHLLYEVASALGYAHTLTDETGQALGIVHRDVSPSNVMVTKLGSIKLLDFGIAKAARAVRDEQTRTGILKGKLSYMSPEQADGQKVDWRSDIFALGIIFWECLTQRRLFRADDDLGTLRRVREAQVSPPSTRAEGIDPEIDAICMRMLARHPDDRYQSCEELMTVVSPLVHRLLGDATAMRRFLVELGPFPARVKPPATPAAAPTLVRPSSTEATIISDAPPEPKSEPAPQPDAVTSSPYPTEPQPALDLRPGWNQRGPVLAATITLAVIVILLILKIATR